MNNLVNKLNEYLKLLTATGIKFKYDDTESQHNVLKSIK